jgi:hypothetical protein
MNVYKATLLCKEFPFLEKLFIDKDGKTSLSPFKVTDIKIKRGDKNLLTEHGYETTYDWMGGYTYDYEFYFIIFSNEKGEQQIIELESANSYQSGSGENHYHAVSTIGEQLYVMKINPDYVIKCVKNDTDANGNGEVTHFWTIFKMSKFDTVGYHKEQIDKIALELKSEIDALAI